MNVIDKFENTVKLYKEKVAFYTDSTSITFSTLLEKAKIMGTHLIKNDISCGDVVLIYMERSIESIVSILGVIYSGATYVVLDEASPIERINKIIETTSPKALIHKDILTVDKIKDMHLFNVKLIDYMNAEEDKLNEEVLRKSYKSIISTSALYILFTSGSTGVPKGCVVTHLNVLSYIEWVSKEFEFNQTTRFASQAPLYFSMSITDVYSTLFCGCSYYITPKVYFSFPVKLIDALNKYEINTIYWVPSAYQIITSFKMFDYVVPKYLKLCLFAGEVMPPKVLRYFQLHLKNASFANLFGPTETTDICTFYKVDHLFSNDEVIPIGVPCGNLDVFLINDKGEKASCDEVGELYCRGEFVAMGYFNNPQKTTESFVQNPLNKSYPEIVYKTGDLCKYNQNNDLIYISRKDFQIKHMGYRIELGEIEACTNAIEHVEISVVLYDNENDRIILYYTGKITEEELYKNLSKLLPPYMMPYIIIKEKQLKHNQNGKIDRAYYKNKIKEIYNEKNN